MESVREVSGLVAPLTNVNVDTDSIVPARFLRRIERTGWGDTLFYDWRYLEDSTPNHEFVLNKLEYRDPAVLAVGRNFGSGSSREHAVWAVHQFGIQAVISSGLAEIFHKNCFENGLIPVILPDNIVSEIMVKAQEGTGYSLPIDLKESKVWDEDGFSVDFVLHSDKETHEFGRYCLMNGLDTIDLTLKMEDKISAFESQQGR